MSAEGQQGDFGRLHFQALRLYILRHRVRIGWKGSYAIQHEIQSTISIDEATYR